ncbi:MAG: YwqG family protein [Pirellulaceae bacterium]
MKTDIEPLFQALRERIAASPDLARLDLLTLVRPSARLAAQRVPYARIELGASRIGGVPDVPRDFEWPRWAPSKQRDDKFGQSWQPDGAAPLGFIAQIDLSTVSQVDDILPSSGWLYFFYDRYCEPWGYDPADRGCCRVIYADGDRSSLVRAEPPSDADPEHIAYPCLVEDWPELTLPDALIEIEYGTPAYEAYANLSNDLTKAGGLTQHRLLGHPQLIQNPMELKCQLASNGIYCGSPSDFQEAEAKSLESGAVDWRLLLQIDTDEDGPGWMWGDVGRIYFWVKKQDLSKLRFTDVWLAFQCC